MNMLLLWAMVAYAIGLILVLFVVLPAQVRKERERILAFMEAQARDLQATDHPEMATGIITISVLIKRGYHLAFARSPKTWRKA